jgi:ACR3 family arsenite efflux pump ArsB
MSDPESTSFGRNLTLGVAIAMFGLAAYAAIVHAGPVVIVIPVLIGGSALGGWVKARRPRGD